MTEKTADEYGVVTEPGTLRLECALHGPIELVMKKHFNHELTRMDTN